MRWHHYYREYIMHKNLIRTNWIEKYRLIEIDLGVAVEYKPNCVNSLGEIHIKLSADFSFVCL